ncbi:ADP-ribosylation factor-like protein 13B [Amyelois transitella]|uniref:ADP-ribosylation factor-like protein 13B n=1 Tax=Amyelois transitella TaxID=680683 RepID=UPI00298F8323|nr:ADP-ribosylation factor-like protein 13B [Amyelois transitella]
MGNCWAGLFKRRRVRRHIVLILIGLDNAGKTQTVNNLTGEKDDKILPTVGFKAVNLIHKDTPVTIYDLGGGPHFREIWHQYYSEVHGVIFVIDSSDFSRLDECREVLEEVLSHDKISGKPVLVLANKQDKNGALDDIDVVEKLNIEPLVNKYRCPTLVESYSAFPQPNKTRSKVKIDPGLRKGYHWLLNYIVRRYGDINLRVQTDIHADLERRKRMLKTKSSQTNTVDEIESQTGFENPNFGVEKDLDKGLIVVKPIGKPKSVDTTMTIDSAETEDSSNKPKLSPLFGRASNSTVTETVRIELEPRSEYRKLSPLVKTRNGGNHIDFQNRPQSSPSYSKKMKLSQTSQSSDQSQNSSIQEHAACHGDGNRTWDTAPVTLRDSDLLAASKDIVLKERDYTSKSVSSCVTLSTPALVRPASASQLLRRQLELSARHKRRLSLRYMQRNKTSPERLSMTLYEPKAQQRHLDKGDFSHAATIN